MTQMNTWSNAFIKTDHDSNLMSFSYKLDIDPSQAYIFQLLSSLFNHQQNGVKMLYEKEIYNIISFQKRYNNSISTDLSLIPGSILQTITEFSKVIKQNSNEYIDFHEAKLDIYKELNCKVPPKNIGMKYFLYHENTLSLTNQSFQIISSSLSAIIDNIDFLHFEPQSKKAKRKIVVIGNTKHIISEDSPEIFDLSNIHLTKEK